MNEATARKWGIALLGVLGLCGIAGGLWVALTSKVVYEALVRIDATPSKLANEDPYFLVTHFERIRSDRTLGQVLGELRSPSGAVEGLDINESTPLPEAIEKIRLSSAIRQSRGTALVEIRAYGSDPESAADLANSIARVYARLSTESDLRIEIVDAAKPNERSRRRQFLLPRLLKGMREGE